MSELNKKLRKFQNQQKSTVSITEEPSSNLSDELAQLISEREMEEESIQSMLDTQRKVHEELDHDHSGQTIAADISSSTLRSGRYVFYGQFSDHCIQESISLDQNTKSSQLMREISALGEELQKKIICPSCHQDNIEVLEAILDADGEGLPE
ncbi:hypothetical protein MLD38_013186 [Melastoma candidum]|uniref:Uncharacterized protein n=1 Tax=Melastoma candidum TaxID=119954 RepID=A0ACB9RA12_9MYRT|nr:hypothetical protein MLD38_013186 [Melastoma candidum]